jgi:hypothetical protein
MIFKPDNHFCFTNDHMAQPAEATIKPFGGNFRRRKKAMWIG